MESKDLNAMEFDSLNGSLTNYKIILQTKGGRAKPRERTITLKANLVANKESDIELYPNEKENDEMALYAKHLRKYKGLCQYRRKDLRNNRRSGGNQIERRSGNNDEKNNDCDEKLMCKKCTHIICKCTDRTT